MLVSVVRFKVLLHTVHSRLVFYAQIIAYLWHSLSANIILFFEFRKPYKAGNQDKDGLICLIDDGYCDSILGKRRCQSGWLEGNMSLSERLSYPRVVIALIKS